MSIPAVLKTAGASAPPVEDAILDLATYVDAVTRVMCESHAVVHTVLIPTGYQNSIFDDVSLNFDNLKAEAQTWTDITGPSMTQVPQAIITFADSFDGQYGTISEVLQGIGTRAPTSQQKADLIELLKYLAQLLTEQQEIIDGDKAKITKYQEALTTHHKKLIEGTQSITELIKEDKATVLALQADIQKIQADIENIRAAVFNPSLLKVGLKLVLAVFTINLGDVGEFNEARKLVFSIGGIGKSISESNWSGKEQRIAGDQERIQQDQRKISIENQQIVMLTAVAATIDKLVDVAAKAGNAVQAVSDSWRNVTAEVESAITRLNAGDASIDQIIDSTTLDERHQAWLALRDFARKMQFSLSNVVIEPSVEIPSAGT